MICMVTSNLCVVSLWILHLENPGPTFFFFFEHYATTHLWTHTVYRKSKKKDNDMYGNLEPMRRIVSLWILHLENPKQI